MMQSLASCALSPSIVSNVDRTGSTKEIPTPYQLHVNPLPQCPEAQSCRDALTKRARC